MNVLYLLNRYIGIGGIENVTKLLAKSLAELYRHHVTIYSLVTQENISDSSFYLENVEILVSSYNAIEDIKKEFIQILNKGNFQVVVFQDSYAPIEYLLDCVDRKKTKIVIVEHNVPDCFLRGYYNALSTYKWYTLGGFLRRLKFPYNYCKILYIIKERHKKLVSIADKYVLLSDSFKYILKKQLGIEDNPKICSITNPISNNEGPINVNEKDNIALFVGRLTSQKGIKYLVEIWSCLEILLPNMFLLVVGDGEEKEYLENTIKKHGLKNVRLEGFHADISNYYKRSSILLMTSVFEGLPLTLIEAMSYGVIPFAFNSFESLTDIIDDNNNGYIISPFKIDKYVTKVKTFCNLPEKEKCKLRLQAMEKSKCFSLEQITGKWNRLFCDIVK